jgi:hypothetical protein
MLLAVLLAGVDDASAQQRSRVEVGGQLSVFRFGEVDATRAGLGGRLGYDLTDWLTVEGEGTFFPNDNISVPSSSLTPSLRVTYVRRRAEVFGGVKIGRRGERLGVFAKARPGMTRVSDGGVRCEGPECAFILLARPTYRTEFAMDLGGGIELFPTPRTVARVEFGDTMIRHRSFAPPCFPSSCTSHNFATRVGLGLRF